MARARTSAPAAAPALDIDDLIGDPGTHIVVCCGSGGVGKTTTAAAIALRGAEAGRRVVVLTIDPARRLAQALGLGELDNTPRPVDVPDLAAGGSLDAMMLDMKRTFDEVVQAHATPDKAEQILANPFYQAVSSSFAGTQEYMAMERLGQLHAQRRDVGGTGGADDGTPEWDLIVVDTPPSRSALDFLDAPQRLGSFLDGRFVRLLSAPARAGGRAYLKVFSAGVNVVTNTLTKVLGGQVLRDVQTFVAALDTVFGGFRKRADETYALLQEKGTAFVVVATPEHDALREAAYFVDRLDEDGMPLAGLVLNRVRMTAVPSLGPGRAVAAAETLEELDPSDASPTAAVTAALLRLHADLAQSAGRHQALARRFSSAHPHVPVVQVPAAAQDIHDLTGLRFMAAALASGD